MSEPFIVTHAISLTQPWATLMAFDAKRIETRSWRTSYRGWVAIHAAKGFPNGCRLLCLEEPFTSALNAARSHIDGDLPRGCVLAVVELYSCHRTENLQVISEHERAFGDYSQGRWGFITRGVRRLREPIPMKGALSIWKMPRTITEEDIAHARP